MRLLMMKLLVVSVMAQDPQRSPAIGTGICLPEVLFDKAGVPRPSRPPGTFFPGDTGCEMGAYQYMPVVPGPPTVSITIK